MHFLPIYSFVKIIFSQEGNCGFSHCSKPFLNSAEVTVARVIFLRFSGWRSWFKILKLTVKSKMKGNIAMLV